MLSTPTPARGIPAGTVGAAHMISLSRTRRPEEADAMLRGRTLRVNQHGRQDANHQPLRLENVRTPPSMFRPLRIARAINRSTTELAG